MNRPFTFPVTWASFAPGAKRARSRMTPSIRSASALTSARRAASLSGTANGERSASLSFSVALASLSRAAS